MVFRLDPVFPSLCLNGSFPGYHPCDFGSGYPHMHSQHNQYLHIIFMPHIPFEPYRLPESARRYFQRTLAVAHTVPGAPLPFLRVPPMSEAVFSIHGPRSLEN